MKNKLFLSLLLPIAFGFVFFQHSLSFASENKQIIRVGYTPEDDLIKDINHVGFEGYGFEIFNKVEEKSNFKFEYIKIEDDVFKALEDNTVDVIGFYYHTPERAAKYYYLKTPLNAVQTALIAPSAQNRVYDDAQSIDGKTVATYEGNAANAALDAYAKKNNISVNYIIGDFQNYKTLKADYYLAYSSDSNLSEYNNVINFDKRNTYLLSLPDRKEMMDELNEVVYEIVTTEGNFFELLGEKYMGEAFHTFHRSLRVDELQVLRNRTLNVAYNEIARPLTYTNAEGEADGALIDVMNRLIEIYKFDIEYYPYSHLNPMPVLENCDIVLAAAGNLEYFNNNYKKSESFIHLPTIAIANKAIRLNEENVEKESSLLIGALDFLYTDFETNLPLVEGNKFVPFNNFTPLLDAYKNNEIDVAIVTQFSLGFVNSYLGEDAYFPFATSFDIKIHLSIANAIADEYIPIFNIMLDNISEKEYQDILVKNQAIHFHEKSIIDVALTYWYLIVLSIFAIALLILFNALYNQRKRREAIQQAYETDPLTSFMTLTKFHEECTQRALMAENNTYELISFDIDMCKTINTHFGEEQGTRVILNMASALEEAFKDHDVLLCRKIAEQFLIFRRIDEGGALEDICENYITPSIRFVVGDNYNLALSFGRVIISDNNEPQGSYLAKAENARLHAKEEHKTTFITFDEGMEKYYDNKLNVTYHMKEALKNREFSVVYQPKIDFDSLAVGGAEALVRWFPKEGRTIYPDEFIPVFEQNGFILSLDLYVLEEVCRFFVENDSTLNIPRISVNLSAHSILAEDLVKRINEIISNLGVKPERIEFEMTESAVEKNTKLFLQRIEELKACGFYISIDDFGAGVSSLNRLSEIDAHVLKLDKAFFDVSGKEEKKRLVVANIIKMAKDLNMLVVSEGVETQEQALWLRGLKSDYAQGYFFAKPMDENSFKELLASKQVFNID